ncbi:MAG: hypothetical protein H2069_09600 [Legionella sp.]|nr:hypothetical protein [Legionella sp.]
MIMIKILAIVLAWVFFYKLLLSKNKRLPKLKATLITLLFASIILQVSMRLYSKMDQAIFPPTPHAQDVQETPVHNPPPNRG